MPTNPLVSSQDRWKEFFAQQGRQMPSTPRPLPPQSQAPPTTPPMGGGLPPLPQQGGLAHWLRRRQEMRAQGLLPRQQQQQGTQLFAQEPAQQMPMRSGFFGRRGTNA